MYYIVPTFTFSEAFDSKVVPGATFYKITRVIGILSLNTTPISTFSATFASKICGKILPKVNRCCITYKFYHHTIFPHLVELLLVR